MRKYLLVIPLVVTAFGETTPTGTLSVNTGNSVTTGLVFATFADNTNHKDFVNNTNCTLNGSSVWTGSGPTGRTALTNTAGDGGATCPQPAAMVSAAPTATGWTFLVTSKIVAFTSGGWEDIFGIVNFPDHDPFYVFGLVRGGGTPSDLQEALFLTSEIDTQITNGFNGYWQVDSTFHDYATTLSPSGTSGFLTVTYYIDGTSVHTDNIAMQTLSGFAQGQPVSLFGGGINGSIAFGAVWATAKTGAELTSLVGNKNQLVTSSGSSSGASKRRQVF